MQLLMRSILHVLFVLGIVLLAVSSGVFDNVNTDISLDHYAEKPWPVLDELLPWMPMPANTLVNLTYMFAGLHWMIVMVMFEARSKAAQDKATNLSLNKHDAYMMYTLCWIAIIYAPVQLARLLFMKHRLAVVDQWYTLPGFAWAIVWSSYLVKGWSPSTMALIIAMSVLSYTFSLIIPLGFDIALGIHIIIVMKMCWKAHELYGSPESKSAFVKAVLSCAGFVFLKVGDNYFPSIHPVFNYLSGHFWSKICDAFQIYYVGEFFMTLTLKKSKMKCS